MITRRRANRETQTVKDGGQSCAKPQHISYIKTGGLIIKTGYLYEINNKINNKKYIGITYRRPIERWYGHISSLNQGDKRHLYRSIRKYGKENFEFNVLMEEVPENILEILEVFWIKELKLKDREFGYNLSDGGKVNKGYKIPEESKLRGALKRSGKNSSWYGKSHSDISKKKISEANKGKIRTDEVRKKFSFDRKGEKSYMYGVPKSEETKQKLSNNKKNRKYRTDNIASRSVYMIDKNSNEILHKFELISDSVKWIKNNTQFKEGIFRSMIGSIVRVCKNKTKTAYGFKWKYADEGQTTIPNGSTMDNELPLEAQNIL